MFLAERTFPEQFGRKPDASAITNNIVIRTVEQHQAIQDENAIYTERARQRRLLNNTNGETHK
jgi:hypothetical protein